MLLDERADLLERHPFGRGIDGQHTPLVRVFRLFAEVDELARVELAPMEEADGPREQENVVLANDAIEKWLAGPGRLDHAAVVAYDRLKDAKPLPRRNDALGHDGADDGRIHSGLERRDGRDGARVLIAMRQVIQEIFRRDDPETAQRFRARGTNGFQVHHRRGEGEPGSAVAHSSSSSRAYSCASNSRRSFADSPTPTNFTGTSIASCTATTIPPRAVPSTLVTITPVSGIACANARACATAFCPMVASSTSSVS